jgi:asparagine synthase (glutamine-hydrolysing)
MCGIAGIVSLKTSVATSTDRQAEYGEVVAMTRALAHRGPDAEGIWQGRHSSLGHRRLSILDLTAAGRQPMSTTDGSDLHVVFNGEIYNFRELRAKLEAAGYLFTTRTDTEVVLRAYQEWGLAFLERLGGMFAIALWDGRSQQLILARDRVGKKPLFYAEHGGHLYFASEIQGLLAHRAIPRTLNRQGIDHYLSYGYIPAPQSGFSAIRKLPPGHFGIWEPGHPPRLERYWDLAARPGLTGAGGEFDEPAAIEALRHEMTAAVRRRLVSDVPIGAFLSGGIDSSIVVGLMAQLSSQPVRTFSIGFTEARFNELEHARRVARRWGTDHEELIVEPDALRILPDLVRHFGEPYADVSAIPTWYLARLTRASVTVALSGDGGDESFAGYERYLANYLADRLQRLVGGPENVRRLATLAALILPDSIVPGHRSRQLRRFLHQAGEPMNIRYPRWLTYFTPAEKRELYTAEAMVEHENYLGRLIDRFADLDPVDAGMAVDIRSYLPDDLLAKVDIASMAHGLEVRSPFLDQHVMELAASLPVRIKMRRREPKYLLKRAFADLLPPENRHRSKMGFGVPVGEWFRGPLRDLLRETLLDGAASRGLFNRRTLEGYVFRHLSGEADHAFQLWNLLMLELWLKTTEGEA